MVIGAGSTGSSIANYLAKKGASPVVVLDKGKIGEGQTRRSTAVVRLHYSTREVARMALLSYEVLRNFEKETGYTSGFTQTGFAVGVGEGDLEALKENVEMQRSLGINTRLISAEDLHEIEPRMDTSNIAAAAYEPNSGHADPLSTSQSFCKSATDSGAVVMENTKVIGFDIRSNMVQSLKTTRETIETDAVVLASGVWSNQIANMFGESLPITVVKEEIAAFRRPSEFRGNHIVFGDFMNNYYLRPVGDDISYLGSLEPDWPDYEVDPDFSEDSVSLHMVERYIRAFSDRFPIMQTGSILGGWSGLYDVTPDWHPILDKSSRLNNVYFAIGLSGHGFKLCPAIGMMMSDLVLHGRTDVADIAMFSANRFSEGKLIKARYGYGVVS